MPSMTTSIPNDKINSTLNTTTVGYTDGPMFQNDSQKFALFLCSIIIAIGACSYFIFSALRDRNIRRENNNTYEQRNDLPGYAENDHVGIAKERFKNNVH